MIDKKSKYVKQPRKPGYYENDMEGFNYVVHALRGWISDSGFRIPDFGFLIPDS